MNKKDKTLADYMERKGLFPRASHNDDKIFPKKKLTFEEWYKAEFPKYYCNVQEYECMKKAWKAAQENV